MNYKRHLLLVGLLACLTSCAEEEVVDSYVPPLIVNTIQPSVENFRTYGSTVASLEPSNRVMIMPSIVGEVENVYVSLGDVVKVGDLLCVVDTDTVDDQVTTASDAVERATDSINTLLEGMLVKAPVSGYVQSINESLNHQVSASSQLAYLSNQREMTVKIPFLDSYVDGTWIGKTAKLTFTDTDESITGIVTEISGQPDFLYGNISVNYVTVTVTNPGSITAGRKVAGVVDGITCSDNGVFESKASSPVMSGLSGTLDAIYVSVGDYVTAGTTMFRVTNVSTDSQLKSAQDGLADAVKARNDAYDLIADYRVTANVAGTVSNVLVKPFDMISQSSAVVEISTTDRMELTFSVTETVLPNLFLGQELKVTSQGKEVYGEISELSTVADTSTGLFTVKGMLAKEEVLTGTTAQVEYIDFEAKNTMTIPFQSVHFIGEDSFVFLVEDNIAVKQQVEIGRFTEDTIIITGGLEEDDVLISSWSTQLRNGLEVSPQSLTGVEETSLEEDDGEEGDSNDSTTEEVVG